MTTPLFFTLPNGVNHTTSSRAASAIWRLWAILAPYAAARDEGLCITLFDGAAVLETIYSPAGYRVRVVVFNDGPMEWQGEEEALEPSLPPFTPEHYESFWWTHPRFRV